MILCRKRFCHPPLCIESSMARRLSTFAIATIVISSVLLWAGSAGEFRGTIALGPHASEHERWMYVESRNGMSRRVEISHAEVVYGEDVPTAQKHDRPQDALRPGTDVRVTAEEDGHGGWRAVRIEILKPVKQRVASRN